MLTHEYVIILGPGQDLRQVPLWLVQSIRLSNTTEVVLESLSEGFQQQCNWLADRWTGDSRCYYDMGGGGQMWWSDLELLFVIN